MRRTFAKSNSLLKEVIESIPLASQTFSKSYLQYVKGQAPLFITKGRGSTLWDVDGNRFTDMIGALLPVILGYRYKAVDDAIRAQLKKGIIFSLPSPREYELAELLATHIPCAEMVRFGKNGSDATTGAVRIARAATGRDEVVVCGYHGWHDWYIGSTTRDLGVPEATKRLTHTFAYNDIGSLAKVFAARRGKIAAVIMEPMNYVEPKRGFLAEVKKLTHKNGALLIFDEIITGFRFSLGGAQKYFGVIPDLATFGKSMGNGMPISAVVGKRKYMKLVDEVFYSFTQGGEALSLSAAIATIREMEKKDVLGTIWRLGAYLRDGTTRLLERYGLDGFISIGGKPCWQVFLIKDYGGFSAMEMKTFLQQEILQAGFLWYGQHNIMYTHTKKDFDRLLGVYDKVFGQLRAHLDRGTLKNALRGGLISAVFKVR